MNVPVAFQGEVQLLGWSESHSTGAKIVLQLADADDLEAFKLMTVAKGKVAGQRLAIVAVEIGDDEKPKPVMGKPMTDIPKGEKLSWLAVQFCKNPNFWDFAGVSGELTAREWILRMSGCVNSRSELDSNADAAQLFHVNVRRPFRNWMESRK
ncbi:hypothetical protein ACOTCJ_25770 [Achromobacter xylosoxidans]|uniref:hypothetical protein n=1 Tax=Alcaligenes xylosoxydans xylosoxydans TaxID=85698 RepID=UPI001EEF03CD|nr:hypothetical protein [Achromobacter xylosoxidans]